MKSLYEDLLDKVRVGDDILHLDLSFDNVLRFFAMVTDESLSQMKKIITAYRMFVIESDSHKYDIEVIQEIVQNIIEYLQEDDGDDNTDENTEAEGDTTGSQKKYYDLDKDADWIYASFLQEYGIDLYDEQGRLHWFKFRALLAGLRDDTKFKEIIGIRASEMPKGNSEYAKEERKRLKKLKEIYALEKTQEQADDELGNMFNYLARGGN